MPSIDQLMQFEFRVADIISAEPHPNADKLYVLKIRVGENEKQIVAGIREYYAAEALPGKKIIIVDNLDPAVIRGVESQGMLLAAKDENGLSLIVPEKSVLSGSRVK